MPAVMAGVANANSRLHAPNENVYLEDCFEGIRFVGELIRRFAWQIRPRDRPSLMGAQRYSARFRQVPLSGAGDRQQVA
jgi:hypothetical protein